MDTQKIIAHTIELMGGREKAKEITDAEFGEVQRRWNQDITTIGRILRAHLFVEHYLNEHLMRVNPKLGSVEKARLSFAQKTALLNSSDRRLSEVLPGIRHLNAIRNRLAHRLSATVDEVDAELFLKAQYFAALRTEGAKPGKPTEDPLNILEEFARYASTTLTSEFSPFSVAFSKALSELGGEDAA